MSDGSNSVMAPPPVARLTDLRTCYLSSLNRRDLGEGLHNPLQPGTTTPIRPSVIRPIYDCRPAQIPLDYEGTRRQYLPHAFGRSTDN